MSSRHDFRTYNTVVQCTLHHVALIQLHQRSKFMNTEAQFINSFVCGTSMTTSHWLIYMLFMKEKECAYVCIFAHLPWHEHFAHIRSGISSNAISCKQILFMLFECEERARAHAVNANRRIDKHIPTEYGLRNTDNGSFQFVSHKLDRAACAPYHAKCQWKLTPTGKSLLHLTTQFSWSILVFSSIF